MPKIRKSHRRRSYTRKRCIENMVAARMKVAEQPAPKEIDAEALTFWGCCKAALDLFKRALK